MSQKTLKLNRLHQITYRLGNRIKTARLKFTGISRGGTLAVFSHINPEEKTLGIPLSNIENAELVAL